MQISDKKVLESAENQTKKLPRIRDAKSEEHEERAPAIFPPAVLIFGLPTQKKYAKIC